MSSTEMQSGFDRFSLPQPPSCGQYEPSIASSASSQQSIFSDTGSAQSSIASSISDDFRSSQEDIRQQWLPQEAQAGCKLAQEQQKRLHLLNAQQHAQAPSYADITSVPSEQRQHPRRSSSRQKPPPLVRQCERKINFVDNLVDSATQMVEVIWPLSVVPCRSDGGSGRGVLPLRTYIEETLRRSRTSYSTLQVALYYLVLIKPFVPKSDFTMELNTDCPANRALMCGRRMFLAALVLASKYLQDRNYSAKAWSKMSGLPVREINTNERTFLNKVCWQLHIPEPIFKRWTDIVLKYTPHSHPPSPGNSSFGLSWKGIVPLLTQQLDKVPLPESKCAPIMPCAGNYGLASPTTPTPTKTALQPLKLQTNSQESTPTPLTVIPRFLEPRADIAPPTPALARMGPLPTPQMTPSTVGSNTPAASICSSRRPSMCSAMAFAQKAGFNRCAMDAFPGTLPGMDRFQLPSRRPSISTASSVSSPESMMSDRTRSSRASSISSVSTVSTNASAAPQRACLARQATCRNAGILPALPAFVKEEKEGSAVKPIVIADDMEMASSPEVIDFTVSEKAMHAPHRHSKHAPHHAQPVSAPSTEKGRKRARPRGGRRSDLEDEIRFQLEQDLDDMMDLDNDSDAVSPSPAADYASRMLSRSNSVLYVKEAQPAAGLSRRESQRIPMQKNEGKKRTCCTASAMSISPSPSALWGELM